MNTYMRQLTLRARLGLLAALAVAIAVSAVATAAWIVTREQLTGQLDSNLRSVEAPPGFVQDLLSTCGIKQPASDQRDRTPTPYTVQVITSDGAVCSAPGSTAIKVVDTDISVARGVLASSLHDAQSEDGQEMRVATSRPNLPRGLGGTYAVSIAQPLSSVTQPLNSLALLLLGVAGIGVIASATAGIGIARAGLRPVERLTATVEHIARTEDLTVRIPAAGDDEIARLAKSFNAMTEALATSRDRQQQLIADAGHELRTPLTSLRTNIELLIRSEKSGRQLPEGARADLLASVAAQIGELAGLIGDLQELSRPDSAPGGGTSLQVVPMHEVARRALERAKLRGKNLAFTSAMEDWFVLADPATLERAVVNLLDNAVKFSPEKGTVKIALTGGQLTVRDEGPGVMPDDLPYVFDRFWRSPTARSLPGSGLGLSIVARVVQRSGGTVSLRPAEGGGTEAIVLMPGSPTPPSPPGPTPDPARSEQRE
ncbi:HAMP domain-containing sensor histidine kinase [Streptomyces longhuiensis]|uniref:sensor histidine kinase n=1 Tax=Streptomyces longhuiensis TaxID=2880933 RepID=UPI00311B1788